MFIKESQALLAHLRQSFEGKTFDYHVTIIESFYWLKIAIDNGLFPIENLTTVWLDLTLGTLELGHNSKGNYTLFNCETGETING